MRPGDIKCHEEEIQKILEMRLEGHSYSAIGRYFARDHTTIMFHCKKAGLSTDIQPIKEAIKPKSIILDSENVNGGKDYSEYLEEESKRKWKNRKDLASVC